MQQFIRSGAQSRQAFAGLVEHINSFDFEDRKKVQELVTELLGKEGGANELVMVIREAGPGILDSLLTQYEDPDNAHFVGEYLRMFAQYPALLKCWCKMSRIQTLLKVILNFNFNIQSDAVETTIVSGFKQTKYFD